MKDLPDSKDSFIWVLEKIIKPCDDETLGPTYHVVEEIKIVASIQRPAVEELDTEDLVERAKHRYCVRLHKIIKDFSKLLEATHLQ